MASLSELKARIIAETNRADLGAGEELEDMLALCIARAIEHHSDEQFWFNRESATAATAAGKAFVPTPYAVRIAHAVAGDHGPLRRVPIERIEQRGACAGAPREWAAKGDLIALWPVPDVSYALTIHGVAQIDAPESASDCNAWTNEAADLIAARARFLLYRDIFRDVEGTQLAAQAEGEALSKLRRETRRRGAAPLQSTGDEPWSCASPS